MEFDDFAEGGGVALHKGVFGVGRPATRLGSAWLLF